jgi:hypothetical protein
VELTVARGSRDPLLYFSPVDGGIEHSITKGEFLESLFYNLLLEPNGLLITDVFFFNCKYLIELAEGERHSLFTRALEESLVVPAFRSESTEDFVTSLRRDIRESNVQGVEDGQYSTSPLDLARWLDRCYSRSDERARLVWPPDMGAAFGDLMVQVFAARRDPGPVAVRGLPREAGIRRGRRDADRADAQGPVRRGRHVPSRELADAVEHAVRPGKIGSVLIRP